MVAVFPIGTILSFYFLPCTEWENAEDKNL